MKDRFRTKRTDPRVIIELSSKALINNYQIISEQSRGLSVIPMVKANAYGHGAEWVAKQLQGMPDLYGFGVATLEEAVELRTGLGARGRRTRIIVFSGTCPWTEEKGRICERYNLTAAIASDSDWHSFLRQGWPQKIAYELKFNTGMNRLGMSPGLSKSIGKTLRDKPSEWHPSGVMTHLAMGESPEAKLSRAQRDHFVQIRKELASLFPSAHFHFANSAAIWNQKLWGVGDLSDVVRPGISLYGVPPWQGAPVKGLVPVMTVKAKVIELRKLRPGESTGYGATFTAQNEPFPMAVLSAGYADGIHRALSNVGAVWLSGKIQKIIGIVSMDLSAVGCGAETRVGEWAEFVGPNIDIWNQARAAGTIPYELLTSISSQSERVERRYD